jgi:hypothetical protein
LAEIKRESKEAKMKQTNQNEIQTIESGKNMPEKKFRAGPITATVWKNQAHLANGEEREFRTVSFDRSYKDKTGIWKNTNSLRVNDLPKAQMVLGKAYEYLALVEQDSATEEVIV